MKTSRGERWCGDKHRPGVLQRLGGISMMLSFAAIVVACQIAPTAQFVYAGMVAAHVLLYTGFVIMAAADSISRRPFSWGRLVLTLAIAFLYAVSGPILMSALAASQATRLHLNGYEYNSR